MMSYLRAPDGYTRVSLTLNLARLTLSIVTPRTSRRKFMWFLRHFICSVITPSRSKISTLLVTLVYLDRVKTRLDPTEFGPTLVCERIFIGALVLATKYTEDACPRSVHWAPLVRILTAREISHAELLFLHALEWNLSITEEDVQERASRVMHHT